MTSPRPERRFQGIPGSSGIAIGPAWVERSVAVDTAPRSIADGEILAEAERFRAAIERSRKQLETIRRGVENLAVQEPRLILDTHILILQDEMLVDETIATIARDKVNAESALQKTMAKVRGVFAGISDEYFRERLSDVDQVAERVFRSLAGHDDDGIPLAERARGYVIVHHDLTPADTAQLQRGMVLGFATDTGGKTSHTVIMARSLEIPAVVGLARATAEIEHGSMVILDGSSGLLIADPDAQTLAQYRAARTMLEERERRLRLGATAPATTKDGVRILLSANVELAVEGALAHECGADGVGMFRTEFLFMNRRDLPSEEEQYNAYRTVVEALKPRPVTIRTLDIGGDKLFSPADRPSEANPALGLRAIRYCFKDEPVFRAQLRAILRASAHGPTRILLPMISGLEELRWAREQIKSCADELARGGIAHDPAVQIGIMIEIPSAAMLSDLFAREVDFFSIGTNDLIQYTLAIDRGNEDVAYLYEPLHPALLRLLKRVIDAGDGAGLRVNLCGEMGSEPQYLPVLLGLGLRELSMHAVQIPRMKKWVGAIDLEDARRMAAHAMTLPTAKEVREFVNAAQVRPENTPTSGGD